MPQISKFNKNNHTDVPKNKYQNSSRLLIRSNACQLTVEKKIQSAEMIKTNKQTNKNTVSLDFYTQSTYFSELKAR